MASSSWDLRRFCSETYYRCGAFRCGCQKKPEGFTQLEDCRDCRVGLWHVRCGFHLCLDSIPSANCSKAFRPGLGVHDLFIHCRGLFRTRGLGCGEHFGIEEPNVPVLIFSFDAASSYFASLLPFRTRVLGGAVSINGHLPQVPFPGFATQGLLCKPGAGRGITESFFPKQP